MSSLPVINKSNSSVRIIPKVQQTKRVSFKPVAYNQPSYVSRFYNNILSEDDDQSNFFKTPTLEIPKMVVERTKTANGIYELVQNLNMPVEQVVQLFTEYKNNYAKYLEQNGYSKSFIEDEINHVLVSVMRKLSFNLHH